VEQELQGLVLGQDKKKGKTIVRVAVKKLTEKVRRKRIKARNTNPFTAKSKAKKKKGVTRKERKIISQNLKNKTRSQKIPLTPKSTP